MMNARRSEIEEKNYKSIFPPRNFNIKIILEGNGLADINETLVLCLLNGLVVIEQKWTNGITISNNELDIDINDPMIAQIMADTPLVLLLRPFSVKVTKDPDPYTNSDNRAGANVDLFPLLLGETKIQERVSFVDNKTGNKTGCYAEITIVTGVGKDPRMPLLITMLSATCLPQQPKEGTAYLAALALDDLYLPISLSLGMSSDVQINKCLTWGSINQLGYAAQSKYCIPRDDNYVPPELNNSCRNTTCVLEYWNVCRRLLVDYDILRRRLETPFFVEIAGTLKTGKTEVRGRYMGFLSANVILEPGEYGANISVKLYYFNESGLPNNVKPLLDLPASSAKQVVKGTDDAMDEFNHMSFVTLRFDVTEPIVPKLKNTLPFYLSQPQAMQSSGEFQVPTSPTDTSIDVQKIRKEGSALGVHWELNKMTCDGVVLFKQSIKKTAANRLLTRVKSMLKQFPPDNYCSSIDWQYTVSLQHSAARRAIIASFSPQTPCPVSPSLSRVRSGGKCIDTTVKEIILDQDSKNPKTFLLRALRCLEEGKHTLAREYLLNGLNVQSNNKYLLWMLGAQEFDQKVDGVECALSIFNSTVKGSNHYGISTTISWAAQHGLYHFINRPYCAFLSAKKMRKAFQASNDWQAFLENWIEKTGVKEYLWNPRAIESQNPLLLSSAFLLCLKSYKLSEILLSCVESGCDFRGTEFYRDPEHISDVYYLRAASFLLRGEIDKAVVATNNGIKKCGPSSLLSQIKSTSMLLSNGWDGKTEKVFNMSEASGAMPSPYLLLRAALGGVHTNSIVAFQRAATAHKVSPSAYSALVIARIYLHLEKEILAERWAAAAVDKEPCLADGWAFLACLALRSQRKERAKSLIRTAYQVGPISKDILIELHNLMATFNIEFQEFLVKNVCLCQN